MNRKETVLQKLAEIPDIDWNMIAKDCKKHIQYRVGQKTLFGAHSEKNLNETPFTFYFNTSVEKLYTGVWDWKFEKFTITEQLIRIIDSLISEEVRKYKCNKDKIPSTIDIDTLSLKDLMKINALDNESNFEKRHQMIFQKMEEAIKGDFELEYIFECFREGKSYNEIVIETGIEKKQLYKTFERMIKAIRSYFEKNNIRFEI